MSRYLYFAIDASWTFSYHVLPGSPLSGLVLLTDDLSFLFSPLPPPLATAAGQDSHPLSDTHCIACLADYGADPATWSVRKCPLLLTSFFLSFCELLQLSERSKKHWCWRMEISTTAWLGCKGVGTMKWGVTSWQQWPCLTAASHGAPPELSHLCGPSPEEGWAGRSCHQVLYISKPNWDFPKEPEYLWVSL